MGARRVAVTGIGVVSALGNSLEDFYRSLAAARSGVRRLPAGVTLGSGVQVGALAEWDPACAVRHVALKAMRGEVPQAVMSNSFAFGGSNVVLIAERA